MVEFLKYIKGFINSKDEDGTYNIEKYDIKDEDARKIYNVGKNNIQKLDYEKIEEIWYLIETLINTDLKDKYNSYIDIREIEAVEK